MPFVSQPPDTYSLPPIAPAPGFSRATGMLAIGLQLLAAVS